MTLNSIKPLLANLALVPVLAAGCSEEPTRKLSEVVNERVGPVLTPEEFAERERNLEPLTGKNFAHDELVGTRIEPYRDLLERADRIWEYDGQTCYEFAVGAREGPATLRVAHDTETRLFTYLHLDAPEY